MKVILLYNKNTTKKEIEHYLKEIENTNLFQYATSVEIK
jgi:hypothetical protein